MIDGGRIDERCKKNSAFMNENEGYRHYNRMRNEQLHEKLNNTGEQDHHGLTMGIPTNRGPHHSPTMVATVRASLQFSFPFSSCIFLTRGTCYSMLVFGHFGPT